MPPATLSRRSHGAPPVVRRVIAGALVLAAAAWPLHAQGARVIYATDFSGDAIGDFPRAFTLKEGNMDVVDVGGTRYLRATSDGDFIITLPEKLPERFTMEFDVASGHIPYQEVYFVPNRIAATHVAVRSTDGGLFGNDYNVTSWVKTIEEGTVFPVRVVVDGHYVKVFMDGTVVANAPNADLGRSKTVRIRLHNQGDTPALIGNIRIVAP